MSPTRAAGMPISRSPLRCVLTPPVAMSLAETRKRRSLVSRRAAGPRAAARATARHREPGEMRLRRHFRRLRRAPSNCRSRRRRRRPRPRGCRSPPSRPASSRVRRCSSVGLRTHSSAASRTWRLGRRIGAGRRGVARARAGPPHRFARGQGMGDEPRRLDQKSGLLEPVQRLDGIVAAGKRRHGPGSSSCRCGSTRASVAARSCSRVLSVVVGEAMAGMASTDHGDAAA